jgi:uncharacterized protein (TIGR00725 family)
MPTNIKLPKQEGPELQETKELPEGKSLCLIENVTFFGDSAIPENDEIYKSVWEAAKLLAENDYAIVNGGGPGVMKAATDGAESVNGKTIAVYWQPKLASYFEGINLANVTDEHETCSNYLQRTLGLIEKGDVYVVCKGGTGTISELGMVWALAKLYYGCHKPVILYGDFWDELIESFQKTLILDEIELGVLYRAKTPQDLLQIIKAHEKKIQHCRNKAQDSDEAGFILAPHVQKTVDTYDQVASSYHSEHAGKLASQAQLDEFISMVNPPAKVLDIGTGPGYDAKVLSDKYTVTGIEPSKKFFSIASYECPNVEMILGDFVTTDLGENVYKGIWARDSIHHIPEKDQDFVFQKMAKALVQGGILYTIVREGQGEFVERARKSYGDMERFYHLFSSQELIDRAERAGFELVKIDHTKRSHDWLVGVFRKK